jgi:GDP-L-fucose synthase
MDQARPDVVFVAAAKVGGIQANNNFRADFIYENIQVQTNLIWAAHRCHVKQLVFLGSSCIYPRMASQPMDEMEILTGPPDITNRPYALAKIAGLELVNSIRQQYGRNYFSVMPTNLYGPRDNFHPENSHVVPALIRRFCEAKRNNSAEVVVWGTGTPLRELMFVDDCADAIVFLTEYFSTHSLNDAPIVKAGWSHFNVGSGQEVSIRDLATTIARLVEFDGKIVFDSSKPDGTPRKLMDSRFLRSIGWQPKTTLIDGLRRTINAFQAQASGFSLSSNERLFY